MKHLFEVEADWIRSLASYLEERADWEIGDYSETREEEILMLFRETFSAPPTPDEWRWKYFKNPCGEPLRQVAVDKQSGKVVAHQACLVKNLKLADRRVKLFMIVDSVVHPGFQRSGLYAHLILKLSGQAVRENGVLLGLPNEKAYMSLLKMQAKPVLTLRPWVRILRGGKVFKKYDRTGLLTHALLLGGNVRRLVGGLKKAGLKRGTGAFIAKEAHFFSEQADALWRAAAPGLPVAIERSGEYLNWRYCGDSGKKYKIFVVGDPHKWLGYIVITLQRQEGILAGVIADFIFDPSAFHAAGLLLDQAENYCRQSGAQALTTFLSAPDAYREIFRRCGYFEMPPDAAGRRFRLLTDAQTLGALTEEEQNEYLLRPDKWFFMPGDTDLV